jgi:hypothetical protein
MKFKVGERALEYAKHAALPPTSYTGEPKHKYDGCAICLDVLGFRSVAYQHGWNDAEAQLFEVIKLLKESAARDREVHMQVVAERDKLKADHADAVLAIINREVPLA